MQGKKTLKPMHLGVNQLGVLQSLSQHGSWNSTCGWLWSTHDGTRKIMATLVSKGLVGTLKKKWKETQPAHERHVLTQAGEDRVQFERDKAARRKNALAAKKGSELPAEPKDTEEQKEWARMIEISELLSEIGITAYRDTEKTGVIRINPSSQNVESLKKAVAALTLIDQNSKAWGSWVAEMAKRKGEIT